MRFDIDIPRDVLTALQAGQSRTVLAQRFGMAEVKARYYQAAFFELQQRRPVAVLADCHIPYHVESVYETILTYIQALNPKMLILLGDYADFYKVSHWRTDPSRMRFRDELKVVRREVHRLSTILPDARKVYINGNHEERMLAYLQSKSAEISDLDVLSVPALLQLKEHGFEFVDTVARLEAGKPPFQYGGYAFLHGHETRTRGGVNIPRNVSARTGQPVIFGHHHKSDRHSVKTLTGGYQESFAVGCCCKLSEGYLPVNAWNHGFLLLHEDAPGSVRVENRRVMDGVIV